MNGSNLPIPGAPRRVITELWYLPQKRKEVQATDGEWKRLLGDARAGAAEVAEKMRQLEKPSSVNMDRKLMSTCEAIEMHIKRTLPTLQ